MADSPLLPLITASAALLGLVLLLGFGVMKLRKAGRDTSAPAGDRLSEEAFAAATIKAALASGPTARPASVGAAGAPADGDTVDAAVLEALPVGLIVTDEAGVVRRCTGPARDWLGIAGPGTCLLYTSPSPRD